MSKEIEFLEEATVSLMATRRSTRPPGSLGGGSGQAGRQALQEASQDWSEMPGSFSRTVSAGSRFRLETPGGGGWGSAQGS